MNYADLIPHQYEWITWVFLGVIIVLGIITYLIGESREDLDRYRYEKKKFFLTRAEHECYELLLQAVENKYRVFAQVHLDSFLTYRIKGQSWKGAFQHINQKSVDYLLCDKENLVPIVAIELDDSSHELERRKLRDVTVERILEQAAVPLLRIPSPCRLSVRELEEEISKKLLV